MGMRTVYPDMEKKIGSEFGAAFKQDGNFSAHIIDRFWVPRQIPKFIPIPAEQRRKLVPCSVSSVSSLKYSDSAKVKHRRKSKKHFNSSLK